MIDGWKNRGLAPTQVPAGEARAFGNGKGGKLYASYQERLKTLNAADFGDLLLRTSASSASTRTCCGSTRTGSVTSSSTSTRTPTSRSISGCGCWRRRRRGRGCRSRRSFREPCERSRHSGARAEGVNPDVICTSKSRADADLSPRSPGLRLRAHPGMTSPCRGTAAHDTPQKHLLRRRRRPVDLWLARRGGRQHPALRSRFSRRKSHPPRTQLPLDRPHPRRRLASDRAQRRPARQDAAHRGRRRREGHRHRLLGFGRGSPRHRRRDRGAAARRREPQRDRDPGARLVPDARVRRSFRHARPALSRDRRSAVLRARRNPRRAGLSARDQLSRPTTSPSSASSTCPSAGSATPPCRCCTTMPASAAFPCSRPPAPWSRPTS